MGVFFETFEALYDVGQMNSLSKATIAQRLVSESEKYSTISTDKRTRFDKIFGSKRIWNSQYFDVDISDRMKRKTREEVLKIRFYRAKTSIFRSS